MWRGWQFSMEGTIIDDTETTKARPHAVSAQLSVTELWGRQVSYCLGAGKCVTVMRRLSSQIRIQRRTTFSFSLV